MIAIDDIFNLNYHLENSDKFTSIYLFLQIGCEPAKLSIYIGILHMYIIVNIFFAHFSITGNKK